MLSEREPASPGEEGTSQFDVFLSHNSRDKAIVTRLAEKLKRAGIEPWLDAWCLVPGADWQHGLAEGLLASRSCAVVVGPSDLGAWANQEVALALDRAAKDSDFRLFLVLLPGLPEPFDAAGLLPFLRMRTWVDYRRGLDDSRALQALISAVKGIPPGPEMPLEPTPGEPPYRGLQVFDEEHADLFFGRESDVQRLLEKLKGTRFLAVLGDSGSGKSSLVRAGLVPALRRGALSGSDSWQIGLFRPGPHPLEALAARLLRLGGDGAMQSTLDGLRGDARTLHLAASAALADEDADARLVLVVDQFEELFTLCLDEDERSAFLANLLHAASIPGGRTVVVLAMRADFYHRCGAYPELAQQLASQYLVSPLGDEGLLRAIEEPARRTGLELEPGLVATIVEDVAGQPGSLPLLEHALLELWERRRGAMLTLEGYRESGGVQGALAKRADEVLESLAPSEQEVARRTFLRLTQPGEGTEDTRRRAGRTELEGGTGDASVDPVLRVLVDARLLTTSRDDALGGEVVEVAHEALIRGWPQLRQWVDASRADLRIHRRLTEAAQEWARHRREEAALYRGARLAEALEWQAENDDALNYFEREFLEASRAAQQTELEQARQRARRLRALAGALGALLLVAVGATFVATRKTQEANDQERIATSRALASAALAGLNEDPARSVALARRSVLVAETPEAVHALRRSLVESRVTAVVRTGRGAATTAVSHDGRLALTGNADTGTVRLWRLPATTPAGSLPDHPAGIGAAAFAANAPVVATVGRDGIVRVFALHTRRLVARLPTEKDPDAAMEEDTSPSVAVSPDARLVATLASDGTVTRVWSVSPRRKLLELAATRDVIGAVSPEFSEDGRVLVVAAPNGGVRVLDARTLATKREIHPSGRDDEIANAAISPHARLLATSDSGALRLWRLRDGKPVGKLKVNGDAWAVFGSDDDSLLVSDGLTTVLWSVSDGRTTTLAGHESFVNSLGLSRDGSFAVTAGDDGTARVWDPYEGTATILRGHRGPVLDVWPDGRKGRLVTAGADGTVRVWDVVRRAASFKGSEDGMSAVAFSSNGRVLAAADADSSARLWDVRTGRLVHRLDAVAALTRSAPLPDDAIPLMNDLAFASGGRLVTAGDEGGLIVWDIAKEKPLRLLVHHGPSLNGVAVGGHGRMAVTTDEGGTVRLWNLDTGHGRTIQRVDDAFVTTKAAFDVAGDRIAIAGNDGGVRVYDVRSGKSLRLKIGGRTPEAFSFSPDGRRLAVATDDYVNLVFDLSSRRVIARLYDATEPTNVAFSPDGRFLATTSWDSARIWDVATWKQLIRLPGLEPEDAAFSPDSLLLAVVGAEGGNVLVHACPFCGSVDDLLTAARRHDANIK
ncbi:MAG TPA: TIR domain-containing protein [Gaiellaceae bacterium]